jgi:7-carboxy-7-deazaguanine synthase
MSISPKLSNSTPSTRDSGRWADQHERLRWRPDVIRELMRYPYQLKFVLAEERDVEEVLEMIREVEGDPARVVLMPLGTTPGEIAERGRWIAELCKKHHFRYSPRVHIDLWGDRRGV